MAGRQPDICVFHLVWAPLGLQPFEQFLSSYRSKPSGVPHRLRILFNGFESSDGIEPYLALLDGIEHETLVLISPVQDIAAYFQGAKSIEARYVCFLNSYSVVLAPEWLAKLYEHARLDSVSVVGATGSCESRYSWLRQAARASGISPAPRRLVWEVRRRLAVARLRSAYVPFPNPHIRTNAFMIRRDVLLGLKVGGLQSKEDVCKFESGRRSLTRQLLEKGLEAQVVGRDGRAYGQDGWYESSTFRSGGQANLLIADNRTAQYAEADPRTQEILTRFAWGDR